ncbi:putative membrane protein [Halorhabdus sp. SVX81]|uniref:DUF2391 family protein n=1 Tax=Halorhabdus sp. SVX81 TaxID=2978283 RepID=UPI0023D9DA6C|nr:DUF2391 domain-containing protein [Halorhabdus sp. SVX81]WEL18477.1 putative membrane protein [Halorhabdus sp. SVX81]
MVGPPRYKLADTAQQIVGGFLLAGPFVVTEEVWTLARGMTRVHALATAVLVAVIGYGALYQADDDRDPDSEAEVAGLPLRFLSLISVAFGSVALLAILLNAPASFLQGESLFEQFEITLRVVSVGAIFSVVGAATADSVF